jgi:hypothetical protein
MILEDISLYFLTVELDLGYRNLDLLFFSLSYDPLRIFTGKLILFATCFPLNQFFNSCLLFYLL